MSNVHILAIETSVQQGSISVYRQGELMLGRDLPDSQRTAKCLVPEVKSLLNECDLQPREIELVAVSRGPGSFTGLRIGLTFAKTFAYGTGAKLIGVPTADAIALKALTSFGNDFETGKLNVVIDAQRRQVYCQAYELNRDSLPTSDRPFQIVSRTDWLRQGDHDALITGPGLKQILRGLDDEFSSSRDSVMDRCLEETLWEPKADEIGRLAWHRRDEVSEGSVWDLLPEYGRQSAAEEKAQSG